MPTPETGVRHEEADRVAVRAAAEAVIELLRRADGERRGFLAVEGAEALEIGTALLQLDVARDHVHDVDPIEQVLLE
jgi:hypothetical protein